MNTLIVAVDQLRDHHIDRITAAANGWATVRRLPEGMSDERWEHELQYAIAVAGWPPPRMLEHSRVRLVVCGSAGFNDYLGHGIERNADLVFCNSRGTMAIPVAEHAITQMMTLVSKLRLHLAQVPSRDFRRLDADEYEEVTGTTAVIVGMGDIGTALAARCRGLGMQVIGVRRTADETGEFPIVGTEQLAESVAQADHVFITLRGGPDTAGLIDERIIAALKPTAYLYNVSRGSVIDEAALLGAVRSGRIAGVALDVFETEPLPADSPWWDLPNALVTPHVAGLSRRFADRFTDLVVANVTAARSGGGYRNAVDLGTGAVVAETSNLGAST